MTDPDPQTETVRLTADVVLLGQNAEGDLHVLLIKRRWPPFEDCWALPGGHVDSGESTVNAAHRELAEETGLHVGALHPAGVYADPGRDPRGRYVTFAYTARLAHLPAPIAADDAAEASWVPLEQASGTGFRLAFDHGRILDHALRLMA